MCQTEQRALNTRCPDADPALTAQLQQGDTHAVATTTADMNTMVRLERQLEVGIYCGNSYKKAVAAT
jgi:hypothetical protein